MEIYQKQNGTSGQFTTFDLKKKTKTKHLLPGDTLVLADYEGSGIINRSIPGCARATPDSKCQ